jgi:hypothetical protein
MFQKAKTYLSSRDWKFWVKVSGAVVLFAVLVAIGENTSWTAE